MVPNASPVRSVNPPITRDPHPPKDPLVPAFLTTAIGPGWTPSLPAVLFRMDSSGEDDPRRYPPAVTCRAGEQVNAYGTHPRPHRAPVAGFAPSASVENCPEQPTIRDSNPRRTCLIANSTAHHYMSPAAPARVGLIARRASWTLPLAVDDAGCPVTGWDDMGENR